MFSFFKRGSDKIALQNDSSSYVNQEKIFPSHVKKSPIPSRHQASSTMKQIQEPTPNPVHFNRPSPATSPLALRKSQSKTRTEETERANIISHDDVPWRSPLSKRRTLSENVKPEESKPPDTGVPWRSPLSERRQVKDSNDNLFNPDDCSNTSGNQNLETKSIKNISHSKTFLENYAYEPDSKVTEKQTEGPKTKTREYETNGQTSNNASMHLFKYSDGQSYSAQKSNVKLSLLSTIESFESKTISEETSYKKNKQEKMSSNIAQSPPPWRRAKASETVAKYDTSSSIKQDYISLSSTSKESSEFSAIHIKEKKVEEQNSVRKQKSEDDVKGQSEPPKIDVNQIKNEAAQKTRAEEQQQVQFQQQSTVETKGTPHGTDQKEVPWRSPLLKKRQLSDTQSPAFLKLKTTSLPEQQQQQQQQQQQHQQVLQQQQLHQQKHSSISNRHEETISVTVQETKPSVTCSGESYESIKIEPVISSAKVVPNPPSPPPPSSLPPLPNKDKNLKQNTPQNLKLVSVTNVHSSAGSNEMKHESKVIESEEGKMSEDKIMETNKDVKLEEIPKPKVDMQEPATDLLIGNESLLPPPPPDAIKTKEIPYAISSQSPFPPPPPPLTNQESQQINLIAFPTVIPDPISNEPASPEYLPEPVTSRIQLFEKQASIDGEKKERDVPPAKPVAPWVKKTSSGPVQQEGWDLSPIEDINTESENLTKAPTKPSVQDPSVSSVKVVLSQPKEQKIMPTSGKTQVPPENLEAPAFVQHKQLQALRGRPRTRSAGAGDYSHSYVDNDVLKMDSKSFPNSVSGGKHGISPLAKPQEEAPDKFCDPNHPRAIHFQDVSAAAFRIKSGILNTPCTYSNISSLVGLEVFFKKEFNQITGSFKERGARYTLLCLSEEQKAKGVIAASAGNHALALSYHGQDLGIPVTVVMPLVAPIMKVQACRQYGANILVKGDDIGECRDIALKMAKEQRLLYINGYDHPDILAGQGTMGLEIVEQVKNIDAVIVPVGGGGLIAGVALAVKSLYPHIKVIGVESERCPSFTIALKQKKPVYVKAEPSLADGLNVPKIGVNAFATASKLIDKMVVVKEEWIAIAILRLVEIEKAVVEGAGAAALAALLADQLPELKGKRVVIPLCGGNIDTTVLGRCLERGLAADGRLVKFTVRVSDRPGGIADLTRLMANLGVSIKDIVHERAWIKTDIFSVEVKVLCETRDHDHSEQLKEELFQRYSHLQFNDI